METGEIIESVKKESRIIKKRISEFARVVIRGSDPSLKIGYRSNDRFYIVANLNVLSKSLSNCQIDLKSDFELIDTIGNAEDSDLRRELGVLQGTNKHLRLS